MTRSDGVASHVSLFRSLRNGDNQSQSSDLSTQMINSSIVTLDQALFQKQIFQRKDESLLVVSAPTQK